MQIFIIYNEDFISIAMAEAYRYLNGICKWIAKGNSQYEQMNEASLSVINDNLNTFIFIIKYSIVITSQANSKQE